MTSAIVLTKSNGTKLFLSTTTRLVSVETVTSTIGSPELEAVTLSQLRYLAAGSATVEEREVVDSPEEIVNLFDVGARHFIDDIKSMVMTIVSDMKSTMGQSGGPFAHDFGPGDPDDYDWHPEQLVLLKGVPTFILEPIVEITTTDSSLPMAAKLLLDEAGFLTEATVSPASYSLKVWDPPQEESDLGRLPGADAAFMQSVLPIAGATIDRAAMRWPGTTLLRDIIVSLAGSDTVHWRLEPFERGADRHDPELDN